MKAPRGTKNVHIPAARARRVAKRACVGRESNPDQLLGRQLCSPLYHRRHLVADLHSSGSDAQLGLSQTPLVCRSPSRLTPGQWSTGNNSFQSVTPGICPLWSKPRAPYIGRQALPNSRDRIVVSTLRCGRSNPGSNPGHGSLKSCHGREGPRPFPHGAAAHKFPMGAQVPVRVPVCCWRFESKLRLGYL